MEHLWSSLTYDAVITTVEKTLGRPLGNLCLQRNSYINRVFELEQKDTKERFIVKFYRPERWTPDMIREEHVFVRALHAQEIPVVPPLVIEGSTLFFFGDIPFALYPKKGGRALDEFDKEGWIQIGRLLARMHIVGATHPSVSRIVWRPGAATKHHRDVLLNGKYLPPDFEPAFIRTIDMFMQRMDPLFEHEERILLHGDCHKGNLISRPGEGIFIVDFDDICMGAPVQDLWMLLPGAPEECEQEIDWFFEGYHTFRSLKRSSLQLIPALRGMRIVHFAAWCAVQSREPAFADHFPEWGTTRYWNELIRELQKILMPEE